MTSIDEKLTAVGKEDVEVVVSALEEIMNNDFVKSSEIFSTDLEGMITRLKDESFRLAVVGEFSSGKSSFLNALMGKDLLKHGAQETTATITEIHNSDIEKNKAYLDIYFNNGNVLKNVDAKEITEYTATGSKTHHVAKEIDRVVINSKFLENNSKICLVDTPGLNGIADNHREKTIEQIKNAHACIYLMQVRGLGQSDIEFLKYILQYQHNIIFVQNFIDELKRLEGETPEQKIIEQRKIIEEKIVNGNQSIHYKIIGVSSRKALISRSYSFKTYNDECLTDELRKSLYEESRFEDVFSAIDELINSNERTQMQKKDTVTVSLNILEQLRRVISLENDREISKWENSSEGRNAANYSKLIDLLSKNKSMYIQKLANYIESESSEIRKEDKKAVENGLDEIEQSIKNIFAEIRDIETFEKYSEDSLPVFLYQNITSLDEETIKHMTRRFENMFANAVLRFKQYLGADVNAIKPDVFKAVIIKTKVENFSKEEDEITTLRREISQKKADDKKATEEIKKNKEKISDIDASIKLQEDKIKQAGKKKRADINKLGDMPEVEEEYRMEVRYESRGGKIRDFFLGEKKVTRMIPYFDDTEQQNWKRKKSKIDNKYRNIENSIKSEIRNLELEKKQCTEEITHLEKMRPAREKDISMSQKSLALKIEYLNAKREKAKQEYLKEIKGDVLKNVNDYLNKSIHEIMYDNHQKVIEENIRKVTKDINSWFEMSYKNRIRSLKKMLDDSSITKDFDNTSELLNKIDSAKNKLEDYLCRQ